MAPKAQKEVPRKRARTSGPGESSETVVRPSLRIEQDNRYLFKTVSEFNTFNGRFQHRELAQCYFFTKLQPIQEPESAKIDQYINHYNWKSIIECQDEYTVILTRAFYANLVVKKNPFRVTSYIGGKEIELSCENLAMWLGLVNDGEETYPLRKWPSEMALGNEYSYKRWFDRTNAGGAPNYVTKLPALHRLAFLFINNILTPKSTIKTNMEFNALYYLRHLLSLDQKQFNIPFIIQSHMRAASTSNTCHLPYANLIHKILKFHDINFPREVELIQPLNLFNELTNIGWKEHTTGLGEIVYKPLNRGINRWIFEEGALPNQYWDPNEPNQQQQPIPDQPIQAEPEPPLPNPLVDPNIQLILNQLQTLTTGQQTLAAGQQMIERNIRRSNHSARKFYAEVNRRMKNMEEVQNDLTSKLGHFFKPSTSASGEETRGGSSAESLGEDEDDSGSSADHGGDDVNMEER